MKITYLIFLILAANILTWSQNQEISCGSKSSESLMDVTQRGGKYITSIGDLKVLVVFAKFKDDTSLNQFWPADSYPSEMNDFIDPDMQKGSTHFLNLTNYYNQMSFGNFRVTGKAIGVETPFPMSHYIKNNEQYPNRAQANKDIIQVADDSVDYKEFDNWTYISNYQNINQPDGIVDMVIVIWRGLVFTNQWSGESSLGKGPEFSVENNQERIKMDFGGYPGYGTYGSGVTVQYWSAKTRERNFKVVIHEIAHWLINGEHPYNNSNLVFWGMLTLGSEGICANAFEREKLEWLNPTSIGGTILSAPMGDYITTPSAYKYNITNGYLGEVYYFENHQQISIYDNITSNPSDKGIFILHLSNSFYANDCVRVLTSDGFWNWDVPLHTDCWGNDLPAFRKKSINRNGFGNRDKITSSDSTNGFLYSYINDKGEAGCNDWLHGYGFNNSFNTTFNDLFSPWSNPPAKTCNGQSTDFLMEVLNQSGSFVTVRFITQNAIGCKPSKPPLSKDPRNMDYQNQTVITRLAWGADFWDGLPIESDVNWSELQLKIDSGNWSTIYSGANRFWTDSNYVYNIDNQADVSYRVRVRDSQNKWSMWSNIYETRIAKKNLTALDSTFDNKDVNNLSEFRLYQNYPNPFNPDTKIRYSIPNIIASSNGTKQSLNVTLQIYDMLGNEITTLVNEEKSSGVYEVNFSAKGGSASGGNAYSLSSGIYFYKLQAGSFVEIKKMILLR